MPIDLKELLEEKNEGSQKSQVLKLLNSSKNAWSPKEINDHLEIKSASAYLSELFKEGKVKRKRSGGKMYYYSKRWAKK